MKYLDWTFALLFLCNTLFVSAQTDFKNFDFLKVPEYTDCAAVFLRGEMLVEEFKPNAKCKIEPGIKGDLTVSTVQLSENHAKPLRSVAFRVAILNTETNTLWMYSKQATTRVPVQDILKECKPGDKIMILTEDKIHSLTHHVIDVDWSC